MKIADKSNTAVVIPVYNASKHIKLLLNRIIKIIPEKSIYVVDDGSEDDSISVVSSYNINLIQFTENQGKGAALEAGFRAAISDGYFYAITIDSDLQHEPEEILNFLKSQNQNNADIVIGRRDFSAGSMPWARRFSNSTTSRMVSLVSNKKIHDSQCGYRLYNLQLIKGLQFKTKRYQFETEILLKMLKKQAVVNHINIKTIYNDEVSYISHLRDIWNFVKLILTGS